MSDAAKKVIDGSAWAEFCDALKNAGTVIASADQPDDPLTRAEGFRYLSRLTRAALQTFIENADPRAPILQRVVHETAKMGADNPDIVYANAALSGKERYRIAGTRGTVHYISMGTQIGHYGKGGAMPPTGQIDTSTLKVGKDGSFEVIIATEAPKDLADNATWLPMTEETGTIIVRQIRLKAEEVLATMKIERLGDETGPLPLTPEQVAEGLAQSAMFVQGASMLFATWSKMFQGHTNKLPQFDPEISNRFGGLKEISYYHSYWRLADDEALVIDTTPPPCDHWNFQLDNHWMESLDYRYFNIHTNSARATVRPDGKSVRVVVAHTDPGVPNWIQTAGHTFGTMCWRWVRPEGTPPEPGCRVVKLAEVANLP